MSKEHYIHLNTDFDYGSSSYLKISEEIYNLLLEEERNIKYIDIFNEEEDDDFYNNSLII